MKLAYENVSHVDNSTELLLNEKQLVLFIVLNNCREKKKKKRIFIKVRIHFFISNIIGYVLFCMLSSIF